MWSNLSAMIDDVLLCHEHSPTTEVVGPALPICVDQGQLQMERTQGKYGQGVSRVGAATSKVPVLCEADASRNGRLSGSVAATAGGEDDGGGVAVFIDTGGAERTSCRRTSRRCRESVGMDSSCLQERAGHCVQARQACRPAACAPKSNRGQAYSSRGRE